jgi:hypothetical protein
MFSKNSECRIVGNKWKHFIDDESHHSKWEEFRKLAKVGSAHEECSQLHRRLELQDSHDQEEELQQQLVMTMD